MAVEYILDVIKATAGQEIEVCAEITDDEGEPITEACGFMLHNEDGSMLVKVSGIYADGVWSFVIPAEVTKGMKGRLLYCICNNNESLCFRKPFYLE